MFSFVTVKANKFLWRCNKFFSFHDWRFLTSFLESRTWQLPSRDRRKCNDYHWGLTWVEEYNTNHKVQKQGVMMAWICFKPQVSQIFCSCALGVWTRWFQLFRNEDDSFLGHSSMVCDTLLSVLTVILNEIVYGFVTCIICSSNRTSAACFINSNGFSIFAITKFYILFYSRPITSIVTINIH